MCHAVASSLMCSRSLLLSLADWLELVDLQYIQLLSTSISSEKSDGFPCVAHHVLQYLSEICRCWCNKIGLTRHYRQWLQLFLRFAAEGIKSDETCKELSIRDSSGCTTRDADIKRITGTVAM